MPRYKLTLEYHGAPFVGWQRQREGVSVQGCLEDALAHFDPAPGPVQGAGRTDAGVHATGQVAHVDLARAWAPFRLTEALNAHLRPHPIAVLGAEAVPETFHARFDARLRTYRYRILIRRAPLALEAGLAWQVRHPLDVAAMAAAARHFEGHHDFSAFRAAQCQAASAFKTLDRFVTAEKNHPNGDHEVVFEIEARSFLHNQVRSMVGTLERIGAGKYPVNRLIQALKSGERRLCGPVAPPQGLTLTNVQYISEIL
ncbi:MAG: tRNA pseudouridine(38-40) synthase TruA [Pseudomonadota bacterium]